MTTGQTAARDVRYYSVQDVATLLGISRQRVYQYIEAGRLRTTPAATVMGGANTAVRWLVAQEEYERFKRVEYTG